MSKKSKQKSRKRKFRRILCKKQINFHTVMTNKLNGAIHTMASEKEKHVKNPEGSFSRNRKISLEDVVKLTLSMGGANLHKEIYEYYQHDLNIPPQTVHHDRTNWVLPQKSVPASNN